MDDADIIREFLIESTDNLARLDGELIELEQRPADSGLLASIFRTIHTIKGTSGFLGFETLGRVTHAAENLLSQLRDGQRQLTPELVTLILQMVDAVRTMLAAIEVSGREPEQQYADLEQRLNRAAEDSRDTAAPPPALPDDAVQLQPSGDAPAAAASSIRVDVGLLDRLVTTVGELVLARNQILQVPCEGNPALQTTSQRLDLITSELQEAILRTRMQPVHVVWNKLPRVVRDLAAACGKQIAVEMAGADTEIDRSLIEAIKDPLTHIVRNACDHGIEPPAERVAQGKPACGRVSLRAWHEGGCVRMDISDDGAGIDAEAVRRKAVRKGLLHQDQAARLSDRDAVNLVFTAGFSTAEAVTAISGRGVGMDVVRTNVEKIGGAVELSTVAGRGTSVQLRIPLTLAIIPGLIVRCREERFVIPQVSLVELVRLETPAADVQTIDGAFVFRRRSALLPLVGLSDVLHLGSGLAAGEGMYIAVLTAAQRQFGLVVDSIGDTQEIVVKPLSRQLKGISCFAGATILGDGRVALILDVTGIARVSGLLCEAAPGAERSATNSVEATGPSGQPWLLFRAGSAGRAAVPLHLVARLEEVPRQSLEWAAGKPAIQYRGELLRLISVADALGRTPDATEADLLNVIVVAHGSRCVGLVVEEILDVVEAVPGNIERTSSDLLLGVAVLDGKLTDLIDLVSLIEAAEPGWFGQASPELRSTVLLADRSDFLRTVERHALEAEGYRVLEARSPEEVLRWLDRRSVDAVVLGNGMTCREAAERAPVLPWPGGAADRRSMLVSLRNLLDAVHCGQPEEAA